MGRVSALSNHLEVDMLYLCVGDGSGPFTIEATAPDQDAAAKTDLAPYRGKVIQWVDTDETLSPITHTMDANGVVLPKMAVREPTAKDVLAMLLAKGVLTRVDVVAVNPEIANRMDLVQ